MDYKWYELLQNSEDITQGDIIKGCPVTELLETSEINEDIMQSKIIFVDGIVMTQACDIANNKAKNIVICALFSKSDFEAQQLAEGKTKKQIDGILDSICKGQQNSLHIINNFNSDDFSQDYYIVDFKSIYTLPIGIVKKTALNNNIRLRLCPPYREHLSQAFARFFMRVGLPVNIKLR